MKKNRKQKSAQLWLETFAKHHAAASDLETKSADGVGPKYLNVANVHHYATAARHMLAMAEFARMDGDASAAAAFAFAAGASWARLGTSMKTAPAVVAGVAAKRARSTGGRNRKAKLDEPDGNICKRRSEVARLWKLQKRRTPEPDRIKQIAMQISEKYGSQKGNSTQTIRTDLRALHLISPIARK